MKDVDKSPVFQQFIARGEKEYEALSATPKEYKKFVEEISAMWAKPAQLDRGRPREDHCADLDRRRRP